MAATAIDAETGQFNHRRNRIISRTFRKFHDQYDHQVSMSRCCSFAIASMFLLTLLLCVCFQVFTGPPEQTRDYVMRAAKALTKGDWKTCSDLVTNLDVWQLIPGEHNVSEQIETMLIAKIKQMAMEVECDRAPNGYPFVSRFSMYVEAGAFGQDMVNHMELRVGELTPVDAGVSTMPDQPTP